MKILFVIPEYPPHAGGGIVTFYRGLIPELARLGHELCVLVGSALSGKMQDYSCDGVTVAFLDHHAVTANLDRFSRYRALPELQRHLAAAWTAWEQAGKGKGFDLVETTDWGLLFAPWIVEADSPPTVVQLHGSIGQIDYYDPRRGEELHGCVTRLIETSLLACADELQTYSKNNAAAWQALTGRDVTYIPPAWQPALPASQQGDGSPHGLVVGRIQFWKGPTVLCEALRLLGDEAPIIDWVGRDTTYLEAGVSMSSYLAQNYPDVWGEKIIPLGPRSPEETLRLQSSAAFIVVPSTWDVFNYTCVEAMGRARVVLCSEGAGAAGLITDGDDGLTFATNDPVALAESLTRFVQMGAASHRQMGERARKTIETTLSPSRIADQRIAAYEELLRRGKHTVRPNAWLSDVVSPHDPLGETLAFLDRLPLREISGYAVGRTLKKFLH
jgi:glycosyltransferase involved in cell wall biosynthesis